MKLGALRLEELDTALALSTDEGWNQTAADWRRMLQLEPAGCFAAWEGDRLVATVTTTPYGHALAWIGMMVVDPGFRRRGIGANLMRMALDHLRGLGAERIKLDATPAGRPLYESLGFSAEAEIERWQGVAQIVPGRPAYEMVEPPAVPFDLDQAAHGADRSRLLDRLVAEGACEPLVVAPEKGSATGFMLARPGRAAAYLGPLIAATEAAATELVREMLARFAGNEVCLDLHRGGLLDARALAESGLTKRRGLQRMHLGPRSDATAPTICASAGPEFG